eukprot:TRINITY_DN2052_c0_g1_i2.p1 TRINITY_DN2052_c0_g1~~TRINITY_DN2052_c0_g1_i2.p1  ORF type:complete len:374 (-),score=52.23 TRINITY_DN2052_c0_g1_i2:720-1814(-)
MARRPGLLTPRRQADVGGVGSFGSGSYSQKSSSPLVTVVLLIVSAILFVGYTYGNSAFHSNQKKDEVQVDKSDLRKLEEAAELDEKAGDNGSTLDLPRKSSYVADAKVLSGKKPKTYPVEILKEVWEGAKTDAATVTSDDDGEDAEKKEDGEGGEEARDHSAGAGIHALESQCPPSLCQAIPLLLELYGKAMHRVLHIGRGSCAIVHELLKEDNTEVWGLEPEEVKSPMNPTCENFLKKSRIRVAEPGHQLPYRPASFSIILISDVLDKLTPSILRASLKEYARIASRNLIVVVDSKPKQLKSAQGKLLKPRYKAYWIRKFSESGLTIDKEKTQRFEHLQQEKSFKTDRTFFHLIPERLVVPDR